MTFTRDGHLLDLALQRHLVDPETEVQEHLHACERCQARYQAALQDYEAPLPELHLPAQVIPFPTRRVLGGLLIGGVAMAAGALLLVQPSLEPEEFTYRGEGFELQVHRQTRDGSEPIGPQEPVHEGDTLGFRVSSRDQGYLLLGGIDGAEQAYPVYPRGSEPSAEPFTPGAPRTLDVGLELDATPGPERLVAALCQHPLSWGTLEAHLTVGAPLPRDCVIRDLTLEKD